MKFSPTTHLRFFASLPFFLGLVGCTAMQNPPFTPAVEVSPEISYLWPTDEKVPESKEAPSPEATKEKTPIGVNNGIIAVVNEKVITLKEFDAEFFRALQNQSFRLKEDELYYELIGNMIDQILLLDLAYSKEIEISPEEVEGEIESMAKRHPQGWDGLRRDLEKQKSSIEMMKERVKESLMLKTLRRELFGGLIRPSPKDVQKSYQERINEFESPEKRDISLLTIFESDYKNDKKLIKRASDKIKTQLSENDFSKVLNQMSGDGKGDGGHKGYITSSDLAEPISKVAFQLENKTWSGPHTMPGVTFFVKCNNIQEKVIKPLDEVQDNVKNTLINKIQFQKITKAIAEIKASSYIRKLSHIDYINYRKSLTQ